MTLADLHAAVTGWAAAHAPKAGGDAPTEDEALAALADEMEAGRARHG